MENAKVDKHIVVSEKTHYLISVYAAEQRRTIGSIADEAILEYLARREAREYVKKHEGG
jgi:hypothetical protein